MTNFDTETTWIAEYLMALPSLKEFKEEVADISHHMSFIVREGVECCMTFRDIVLDGMRADMEKAMVKDKTVCSPTILSILHVSLHDDTGGGVLFDWIDNHYKNLEKMKKKKKKKRKLIIVDKF